eukprot:scaffold290608_cov14-Tisochrysis_lutea.AAC.1
MVPRISIADPFWNDHGVDCEDWENFRAFSFVEAAAARLLRTNHTAAMPTATTTTTGTTTAGAMVLAADEPVIAPWTAVHDCNKLYERFPPSCLK